MRRDLPDLAVFIAVARLGGFAPAAAELNLTRSAVSHGVRGLEDRLGVRLFDRTTRSVRLTDAGRRLFEQLSPAFARIADAVEDVNAFRARPAGSLRINVSGLAAAAVIGPRLAAFVRDYPDVRLEVSVDDGVVDIVRDGYDAGIRFGERVERDMIGVRVSRPERYAVVGSPAYFRRHPPPRVPRDLAVHTCIGFRFPSSGALYRWEFAKRGKSVVFTPDCSLVLNDLALSVRAAVDGAGLAFTAASVLAPQLADGRLVRVLDDWCPSFPGFYLYYANRHYMPAALRALIDMLRV